MSEQNLGGRPRYYETPEQLQLKIDEYFNLCKGQEWTTEEIKEVPERFGTMKVYPENITITGLILYLGFSHREALHDYEKREGFSDIIKTARLRVENGYENALYGKNPTGPIFALKNMGWKDKTEVEQSGSLTINWNEELTPEG